MSVNNQIDIHLFGRGKILRAGNPISAPRANTRYLLYMLALTRGKSITYSNVMNRIWGYNNNRKNLQIEISHLRKFLFPNLSSSEKQEYIRTYNDSIVLVHDIDFVRIDVEEYRESLYEIKSFIENHRFDEARPILEQQLTLYSNHLLHGVEQSTKENNSWIIGERQTFWEAHIDVCLELVRIYLSQSEHKKTYRVLQSLIKLAIDQDESHLIKVANAIHEFQNMFQDQDYFATLLAKLPSSIHVAASTITASKDLRKIQSKMQLQNHSQSEIFFGREDELTRVLDIIKTLQSSLINIYGLPGFGKSAFVNTLLKRVQRNMQCSIIKVQVSSQSDILEQLINAIINEWKLDSLAPLHSKTPAKELDYRKQMVVAASMQNRDFPLFLVFDEIQEAKIDDRALKFIVHELKNSVFVVLVTSRKAKIADYLFLDVGISGLDKQAAIDMLSKCADTEFDNKNYDTALNICNNLDRCPFYIRLVGEKLKHLPINEWNSWLHKNFPSQPEGLSSHYSVLGSGAAGLLECISLFPIDSSLGAIKFFGGSNWFDDLKELIDAMLIQFDGTRYFTHKMICTFIKDKLDEEEHETLLDKIMNYLVNNAVDADDVDSIAKEIHNLEAALPLLKRYNRQEMLFRCIKLVYQYHKRFSSLNECIRILRFGVNASQDYSDAFEQARFLNLLGNTYLHASNYQDAHNAAQLALDIQSALERDFGIASNLGLIAKIHYKQGKYEKALEFCNQSLEIWRTTEDSIGLARSLRQRGQIFRRLGQFEAALTVLNEALNIERQLDHIMGIASVHGAIGDIFADSTNPQFRISTAFDNFQEMKNLTEQHGDPGEMAYCYVRLAETYRYQGRFDHAADFCSKAKIQFEQLDSLAGVSTCENIQGNIKYDLQDFHSALEHYQRAQEMKERSGDILGLSFSKFGEAKCQNKLGKVSRAIVLTRSTIEDFRNLQMEKMVETCHKFLEKLETKEDHQ